MNTPCTRRCAALLLAALLSTSLQAAENIAPPTSVVSFSDLNLNSRAGIATLYGRIRHSADVVCEMPRETRRLRATQDLKTCKASATLRAVQLVNVPALTALHAARTGTTLRDTRVARSK